MFERLTNLRLTKRAYVGLFVVTFLFVSFFLAWRDERIGKIQAQNQIAEIKQLLDHEKAQNDPNLQGAIDQVFIMLPGPPKPIEMMVQVAITNLGAPSVVEGWRAHIQTATIDQ